MNHNRGLTLVELMVVLVVIAIAAAVGYPLYTSQVEKARRADAQGVMMTLVNELEKHLATQANVGYTGFVIGDYSEHWDPINAFYGFSLTLDGGAPFTYTITATPPGPQSGDGCGVMSIDELGTKTASSANCWK